MISVDLDWKEGACAELVAPNGEVLLSVATASFSRMIHQEDGEVVVYSKETSSFAAAQALCHDYAKAWLASHTSAEEVYGSMEAALREVSSP